MVVYMRQDTLFGKANSMHCIIDYVVSYCIFDAYCILETAQSYSIKYISNLLRRARAYHRH